MAETPVGAPAELLRERESSARTLLPPGGFTLRPFEAWTASPIGPAVIAAAVFAGASIWGRFLIGDQRAVAGVPNGAFGPDLAWYYIWLDGLNAVIFAYIPAALVILRRGIARDLLGLRPQLTCNDSEFEAFVQQATCVPNRRLAICGGIFVLLFALMPIYDPGFYEGGRPPLGDPLLSFFMLRNAFTGWLVGHIVASEFGATHTYRLLGRDHARVDLLDTRPLYPFARRGMRSALTWILAVSLVSLFWLGPEAGDTNGIIIVSAIVLVMASLVYSISGVRDSIRREKALQLDALRDQIRQQRAAVIGDRPSTPGAGAQLADLIAYHALIERAPEWPFDTPMIVRLALFALLGLGSWLGGALVERLLAGWF